MGLSGDSYCHKHFLACSNILHSSFSVSFCFQKIIIIAEGDLHRVQRLHGFGVSAIISLELLNIAIMVNRVLPLSCCCCGDGWWRC